MAVRTARRAGFTMIELLTVIAIIAILAAIIFPVFAQVRARTREASCRNNMTQISNAINQYHEQWGVYPDFIEPVRADFGLGLQDISRLYPQYLKSLDVFHCPNSDIVPDSPNVTAAGQAIRRWPDPNGQPVLLPNGNPVFFFQRFSYNAQPVPNRVGVQWEMHYTKDWTLQLGNISDIPRQLKYKNPAADTVVTWCTHHAGYDGVGNCSGNILVLFLDGRIRTIQGDRFSVARWNGPQDGYQWLARP